MCLKAQPQRAASTAVGSQSLFIHYMQYQVVSYFFPVWPLALLYVTVISESASVLILN